MIGGVKGHVTEVIDGHLLTFYQQYRWKMIPNCTGRYTCRDTHISRLSPVQLIQTVFSGSDTDDSCCMIPSAFVGNDDDLTSASKTTTFTTAPRMIDNENNCKGDAWKLYQFIIPSRVDAIIVIPFDNINETGLITYVKDVKLEKQQNVEQTASRATTETTSSLTSSDVRYVHTLNTKSGFRRKLQAVGIYVDDGTIRLVPNQPTINETCNKM